MKQHFPDALMLSGAAMLSYGAWLYSAPLGFVVGGAAMLGLGFLAARRD